MSLSKRAEDELELIKQGPIFACLIDYNALRELEEANLVERFYNSGWAGMLGVSYVRLKD